MHKSRSKSPASRNFGGSSSRKSDVTRKRRSAILLTKRNTVSQFRIFDENLKSFQRFVEKPNDCVINAMQIIGMIDNNTAELLRIMVGNRGFQKTELENIFMLYLPHVFKFESMKYHEWVNEIKTSLKPGNVIFTGYTGHVFLIGRLVDGRIVMIDPQLPRGEQVCYLEYSSCERFIVGQSSYYILKSSVADVSQAERLKLIKHN